MNRRSVLSFLAGIGAFAVAGAVLAQSTYPTKPVRVIVPYPAGGVVDLFARAGESPRRAILLLVHLTRFEIPEPQLDGV